MYYDGVPEEVRRSLPDNTTEYMRPLPGAARMYPETDVPPIRITHERINTLHLPEKPTEKRQRLTSHYHLNEEQLNQLLSHGREHDFERHITQYPDIKNIILRTYLNTIPELEKEGFSFDNKDEKLLTQVFSALQEGRYAKEAVPTIIRYRLVHPDSSVEDSIQACGFRTTGEEEIRKVIQKIVTERNTYVKEKGMNAHGPLMGLVMKELRGKADGQHISRILHEEIKKTISS
jgi:glutamyl-tRNA(Gln) amidotransferase subunit E